MPNSFDNNSDPIQSDQNVKDPPAIILSDIDTDENYSETSTITDENDDTSTDEPFYHSFCEDEDADSVVNIEIEVSPEDFCFVEEQVTELSDEQTEQS